jgi:hypothetical protein
VLGLSSLLPAPQELLCREGASYQVRLRILAGSLCGSGTCFEAVLLDAALGALDEG